MKSGAKVFLLNDNGDLSEMTESPYNTEDKLQEFLVKYPDLLAGDQIDEDNPRRWLFVHREMGIAPEKDTADRWSLDHLFIDQNGIPTFVECKRSSDTRIRREVVGQMLEYAANATQYWPIDKLRQAAVESARRKQKDLDTILHTFLNNDEPEVIQNFWDTVEQNLRNGKIRLVFVCDSIPKELRRIVEFLNTQMIKTEVIAVEIKQFKGSGARVMVPRVIGITEATRQTKKGKKQPLSFKELHEMAKKNRVGDIYNKLVGGLKNHFDHVRTTQHSLFFQGIMEEEKSKNTIFSIFPEDSDLENGLWFEVYIDRFADYFNIKKKAAIEMLPMYEKEKVYEEWAGELGSGYFKGIEQVDKFIAKLNKLKKE